MIDFSAVAAMDRQTLLMNNPRMLETDANTCAYTELLRPEAWMGLALMFILLTVVLACTEALEAIDGCLGKGAWNCFVLSIQRDYGPEPP